MPKQEERAYDNESIKALRGAQRVRQRPGVIFGSDGLEGCEHSFFEILSNALDEAKAGFGSKIIVTRHKDNSITVQDHGRGIPVDFNKNEGKYNWELLFCELYAGGKYDTDQTLNYEFSLGLNGLGLCATQYASEFMRVEIIRDGFKYSLEFKKGENIGGLSKEPCSEKQTGTTIHWKPDLDVFTEIEIPHEYFEEVLKQQAVVNSPVVLVLVDEAQGGTEEEFVFEEGLRGYLNQRCGDAALTQAQYWKSKVGWGKDREDKSEYSVKAEVAFCFSNTENFLEFYHNSSFLEHGGASEKAVKNAFTSQIDALLRKHNKYLKNEAKISFLDIESSLALIMSSYSSQTSYENQTKKSITNKFISEYICEFLKHELEVYFIENPEEAGRIADQVLINKRSRESAEKTRINIKKKLQGNLDVANRVKKFVDCRTKDILKRELYIVEGDSALGACKLGRNAEFQAIIPVRGKILNCLKSEYKKIFSSEIIIDIMKVLGCGVEAKISANKSLSSFDINQLRWNKIVICTDADVDGFQIRTLILTMFFKLAPELIKQGYVYIAQSPLYEINTKDKTYFAYDEQEKLRICNEISGKKHTIQRSKGLGENEPDMMWLTTMNPRTRRLIRVSFGDEAQALRMFEVLLGEDIAARKEFIAQNGGRYMELLDVM